MELADILALVKAGYTRDEIAQMDSQTPVQPNTEPVPVVETPQTAEPVAVPTQTPVAVSVAQPVPTAQPTQTPPQEQPQPTMADLMQGIAKLTSAVQANAIAQSVIPQGLSNPPRAEDMLAEIIRPTFKPKE
jgi:hypothetical protein